MLFKKLRKPIMRTIPKTRHDYFKKSIRKMNPVKFGTILNRYCSNSQLQKNNEDDVLRKFYTQKKEYFINKHEQKKRM